MINKSDTITELAKAFTKTQKELKQPLKDASNPYFGSKYVPLENVVESITDAASKNGLAFSQFPSSDELGNVTVGTIVIHDSGEWLEYAPIKLKPVKNDPQAVGSAITYAKRYALSAIFGITSDQDDDGNEATFKENSKIKPGQKAKTKIKPTPQPKIDEAKVIGYKNAIDNIIRKTGQDDGSITSWFLKHLGAARIEDITLDQVEVADGLIKKLQEKA
ncbi:ERF family protein [Streptococcus ruminantium]|uniref:ERF family protein n=1 Tax=Streptococcus ruminantium TaxID=1917441 RepID=UPI0012DE11E0|nr:ERF family protein [Streptococcus ruminantium]